MLEEILDIRNVEKAFKQVTANKGAGGIDGMGTDELRDYLDVNWQILRKDILEGKYRPQAVRKKEIGKPQGGKRMLGIPTVIDRLLQQAIAQWLNPKVDGEFSNYSYGFRQDRSAHQAIVQATKHIKEGKDWVVDIDLENFFDRINHDRLMQRLSKGIGDKRLLRLINAYLKAGMMEGGLTEQRTAGTPQGGPLALRTHPQTLSFSGGYKLKEVNFDYIIKSIIFMTNGEITKFGVGQTHQSGVYFAAEGQTPAADSRSVNAEVWGISNTSLSLYSTGQRDQRKNGDTGEFCSVYCQAATYTDQADKEIIGIQGAIDQQSGPYCAGRILSQEGSCQKRKNKLRYLLPMIVCGSKSFRRSTISLFQPINQLFLLNNLLMN